MKKISQTSAEVLSVRESVVSKACEKMAADLRRIDPVYYSQLFDFGDGLSVHNEICEVIKKHFPSGNMIFSCCGKTTISWNSPPVVALDLEFADPPVFCFFRLVLKGAMDFVELHLISFEQDAKGQLCDATANTAILELALKNSANQARN